MSGLFDLRPRSSLLPGVEFGIPAASAKSENAGALADDFFQTFKSVMGEVNRMQFHAEDQSRAFAAGEVEDVHDVALAINKAKFALDLTVRVRDKLLDAYRELSSMR